MNYLLILKIESFENLKKSIHKTVSFYQTNKEGLPENQVEISFNIKNDLDFKNLINTFYTLGIDRGRSLIIQCA